MSTPDGPPVCHRHPDREAHIRCQRCGRPICPECMLDAAVGFQCPTCVHEGRKQTRQGQATYGGRRSANPALTSMVLIGVNAAVWLAVVVTGWRQSDLVQWLGLRPHSLCDSAAQPDRYYPAYSSWGACNGLPDGQWLPGVSGGAYWQPLTSAFLHVEIWHLAANMLALYVLGPQIEAVLGRLRFLALYLVSALTGSAVVLWFSSEYQLTLGASGAIYGLFAALGVVVLKVGGDLRAVGLLLAVNVFITLSVSNISWQGHLGGFVGGAAVTAALVYAPRGDRRSLVQWGALAAVAVLALLAMVVRTTTMPADPASTAVDTPGDNYTGVIRSTAVQKVVDTGATAAGVSEPARRS